MVSTSKILIAGTLLSLPLLAQAETDLPKVTILGKTFYYYESKKGESLFGIANHFGWDPEILTNTNKDVSSPLDKGTLIYYPAPKTERTPSAKRQTALSEGGSITHTVKSGETIYGISKFYDVPLETIYALNPSARDGIRAGQTLTISSPTPQSDLDTESDGITYHKVNEGESLYGIAKSYNTSVQDLYKLNPGISYDNPEVGETIRIAADSRAAEMHTEVVEETRVKSLSTYKVRRGDTWASVSASTGVPVDILKEANPGIAKLKRGDVITLPDVETVEVEHTYVAEDPREATEEGRRELYNEVHNLGQVSAAESGIVNPDAVKVAVVLNDVDSNRDMEFARGALMGVNDIKSRPFPTAITILDGKSSMADVIASLDSFGPDILVTTADKELPKYLAEYASSHSIHLINAFDVKDEAYLENPAIIQYLAPTSYFNDEVATYIGKTYPDYQLLIAGKMDASDTMGEAILQNHIAATSSMPQEILITELADFTLPAEDGKYLIYATPSARDDVKDALERINTLRDNNPMADIRVIGRPNWVTMVDAQRQLFDSNAVLLPSRFYFDSEASASRRFIDGFKALYGHTPMKSYPVYSATAYDIVTYFIPNINATGGDFNATFTDFPTLQSPIGLERVNNWGGFVNPEVYVVEFQRYGSPEKITLSPDEKEEAE